ncbi:organic anion transporter, putative [Plasmodium relictum]|uniref:Organic anion transporter, putative n=1 Tax=Plasmodium relictum TaxID=85471 RepID=A0A1J1H879_PLARL|nr:organic anion transporter, putative [Plasmodium relictum]CRH00990.1 organic anion transporter, putative [Plasmodium relictum]
MNTIEKNEIDKSHLNLKDDHKKEDSSCLKINVYDQDSKAYLSSIDDLKLRKFGCVLGLENYIFKLKKRVSKFYFIYAVVTIIHFLIYVNRGIIPGSYDYISTYLKEKFEISNIDMHIGFLTSVFVFGLSISSVISGSLGSAYSIFKITDIFLFQNSLALFITGISFIIGSYYSLMFSRFFCGFGEAAFITIIPPLIYSYSKNKAGSWISIFITMFPLGGCAGYLLAVVLPYTKITIAQYFIISGFVFFIFVICFYFFDEKMLKEYEDKKSLKKEQKSNKENDIEEGNQLKEENYLKEEESLKNVEEFKDNKKKNIEDLNTTSDKANIHDIVDSYIPHELNVENEKNNEKKKKKKIKRKNNNIITKNSNSKNINNNNNNTTDNNDDSNVNDNNNNINVESKKEDNITADRTEKINQGENEKKKKKRRNKKEKKKESTKNMSDNNNIFHTNNLNLRKLKSRNLHKNKNFKNEHLSLKFSESKKFSSLKNFTNLKHISCIKRINSNSNSRNKNSTDYSDHKSFDSYKMCKKNKMRLYDDELYDVEKPINESNNTSFNSVQKNDNDNSCFINKNKIVKNNYDETELINSNYVDQNSDNVYTMDTYNKDQLCLMSPKKSFNSSKKENNFLDIKDNLEKLNKHDNEELNLNIFAKATLFNPSFLLLVTALTAHSDIIQSYLVYGPAILYALDVYPTYKSATVICSLCACLSSIIGTCLGGFLMDLYDLNIQNIDKNYEHIKNNQKRIKLYNKDILVYKYLRIIGLQTFIILFFGSVFSLVLPFINNLYIFTIMMTFGLTFLFSSMPGHNIGVMVCVPQNIRPFSVGMSSFISHIFGDIPWIVITGYIKGILSPDCLVTRDGEISDLCREQSWGLRVTLLIICSKSLIMTFGSLFLYMHSNKKIDKYKNRQENT